MSKKNNHLIYFWIILILNMAFNSLAMSAVSQPSDKDVLYEDNYTLSDVAMNGKRDPFTVSDRMYQKAGRSPVGQSGSQSFLPYLGQSSIPKMRVRGFVKNGGKEGMALLEIEGDESVHLVKKGDEIGIQNHNASAVNSMVLKIINVDGKKVEVQSGSLKQIFIVQ